MNGLGARKADNLSAPEHLIVPLGKGLVRNGNGHHEYRWGVNLPDNKSVRISFDAMKKTVAKFDLGRPLDKHFRVRNSIHVVRSPRLLKAERVGSSAQRGLLIQPLNWLLPTFRRIEVTA